jgi:hypothetical protein
MMEVNLIVALIRSNQFDQAKREWDKLKDRNIVALKGIGAFFALREKKFDEAIQLVKSSKDSYSVFLLA